MDCTILTSIYPAKEEKNDNESLTHCVNQNGVSNAGLESNCPFYY